MTTSPVPGILVVEDEPDIRHAMTDALSLEGYPVASASNGRQALQYLAEAPRPALVLLDLMMPEMDGRAFLDLLREHPTLHTVPVVMISASEEAREVARVHRADGFIPKPVDIDRLLGVVERYCGPPAAPR